MHYRRGILVFLLTLALSFQVTAAGDDNACHHEHAAEAMMQMDDECGGHNATPPMPCCDNECQCASHMVHSSAFIPDDNTLTVATKPAFQRLFVLQQQVRQPHFPHYRPPRLA